MLRVHKLGEADRIVTSAHPSTRPGARGRQGCAAHNLEVRCPPGARQPHRHAATDPQSAGTRRRPRAPQAGHRHPDRVVGRLRCAAVRRLRPVDVRCRRSARRPSGSPRRVSPHCGCTCLSSGHCGHSRSGNTIRRSSWTLSSSGPCPAAGWEPALRECAKLLGAGPARGIQRAAGGAVCETCRPPGSARPQSGTIDLMVALLSGDWARADASPGNRAARGQRADRRSPAMASRARAAFPAARRPLIPSAPHERGIPWRGDFVDDRAGPPG